MQQIIFWARQIWGPPSYKPCEENQAREVLEFAYTQWIRTYDTAPIYGLGQSEKLIGETFKELRKNISIITKFWFDWNDADTKTVFDFSPDGIKRQLEKSLTRLKTDYIDMYFLHIPDTTIDIPDILTTLNSLKSQWCINSYWLCNTYLHQLQEFLSHPLSQIEYIEDFYNILEKKAEKLIFPYKTTQKFFAYWPLYRGIMTSKTIPELLAQDENAINRLIKNQSLPSLYKQKQLYQMVAKRKWIPIEKIALDFLKHNQQVDGVIIGTKNKEHLKYFLDIYQS